MNDPYLVRRLDHPLLGDAYLATLAASGALFALADWGFLMGLLCGVALGVPAISLTAAVHRLLARHDPRGHRSRLLACLALASVVAGLGLVWVGPAALPVGPAVLAFTAIRTVLRDRHVLTDSPLPAPLPALDRTPSPDL